MSDLEPQAGERQPRTADGAPCAYCAGGYYEGDEPRWIWSSGERCWMPEHPDRACAACNRGREP